MNALVRLRLEAEAEAQKWGAGRKACAYRRLTLISRFWWDQYHLLPYSRRWVNRRRSAVGKLAFEGSWHAERERDALVSR